MDFDWKSFKHFYNEKFEKGKEYTAKIKKEEADNQPQAQSEATNIYLDALQRLYDMKSTGAINEDDYEKLKADIMNKMGV